MQTAPSRRLIALRLVLTAAAIVTLVATAAMGQNPDPPATPPVELKPGDDTGAAPPLRGSSPKERSTDSAAAAKTDKPPAVAGWDDGFFLRSTDKNFTLRITGQIQSDFRGYLNSRDQTDIDTFLVRRARLGIEATVAEIYEFRLLPDFGQGVSRIFDSYLNIHFRDAFQIEMGKFKQPFSYEQLIQDRFVPTMERSLIDSLAPARDVGLMLHGQKLFGDRLDYYVSASNGQVNGDLDLSNGLDCNSRIAVRPFPQNDCWPVLRKLQVGISSTFGNENEPVNPVTLRTPANVPYFSFLPGVREAGWRTRWSPEVAFFFRGIGFAAQYFRQDQTFQAAAPGAAPVTVRFEGYYVLATWLLTGEHRDTYSRAVSPLRPFDPKHPLADPGAWELVTRLSRLNIGDDAFAAGPSRLANPALFSSGASELTVGFNWYLTKWFRAQLNWEHSWFDQPVQLGVPATPSGRLQIQNTLFTRLQVIF